MSRRVTSAREILAREYSRLHMWARSLVDDWSADQICYIAFSSLLWQGIGNRHTPKGAVAHLYEAAEVPLRRAVEVRGGYLAAGAWRRAPWPRWQEGLELSALYSAWVYVQAAANLGPRERMAIAAALRGYRKTDRPLETVRKTGAEEELIRTILRLVAEHLDEDAFQVPNAADVAREVWHREQYRCAVSYRARGSLTGGAAHGEGDQADHSGLPGTTHRIDQLAGLWRVRAVEPVPGAGDDPEPATHVGHDK